MDFATLNELIPHSVGKKLHVLNMNPYNAVTLAMPGRHQKDTAVLGGDFVVMVDDSGMGWVKHQFTHDDIFNDLERKTAANKLAAEHLMKKYAKIVLGEDPDTMLYIHAGDDWKNTLHPNIFLHAVQNLAVAEHRRYGQHEARGGGRYLPARFSSGIVEGRWTAADCKAVQRRGRLGLDLLIKEHGKPTSLKELAA